MSTLGTQDRKKLLLYLIISRTIRVEINMNTKKCPTCKQILPVDMFGNNRSRYDGKQAYCKNCISVHGKKFYLANSELLKQKSRIHWYMRKYGMTYEKKSLMFSEQKGLCAICKKLMELDNRCHVDHDHETGEIRGLLCNKCNSGLHYIENKQYTIKAKEYLRKYETNRTRE